MSAPTIEEIKNECHLAIIEDANSMPVFRGMFKPRAARVLLALIAGHESDMRDNPAGSLVHDLASQRLESLRNNWTP